MARPSPQSFEKRQREIRKRRKREEKLERRLWRNEEKRIAKEGGEAYGAYSDGAYSDRAYSEDGVSSESRPRSEDDGPQSVDQTDVGRRGSAPADGDAPTRREASPPAPSSDAPRERE